MFVKINLSTTNSNPDGNISPSSPFLKSSTSSLTEIDDLSSSFDSESEINEPPSPPETPGLQRKRRREEVSEESDGTPEPPSPSETPVPQDPCKVCGGFEPLDTQYSLVVCVGCQVCVHQDCYGVTTLKPRGRSWRCDPCLNKHLRNAIKIKKCVLCNLPEGENNAMKRTNGNNWVHVLCATFIQETSFYDAENVYLVMDIDDLDAKRWKMICSICQESGGVCIQCSGDECEKRFHVTCAQNACYRIGFTLRPPKVDSIDSIQTAQAEQATQITQTEQTTQTMQIINSFLIKRPLASKSIFPISPPAAIVVDPNNFEDFEDFKGELVSKVYCEEHGEVENFISLNTRGPQSHQSAIYTYIKKHKKYDKYKREEKLKNRYNLTIPEQVMIQLNAQKEWYEFTSSDDDDDDEDDIFDIFDDSEEESKIATNNENLKKTKYIRNILYPSNKKCSRCSVTHTIKWWPSGWLYLPRASRFSIKGVPDGEIICHKCYQKDRGFIGNVPDEGIQKQNETKIDCTV